MPLFGNKKKIDWNNPDALIEARGLTKVFGKGRAAVKAIDGVDLTVGAGEILMIMGPSGSGKTTLLSMLGGLLRPTAGEIRIDDHVITQMPESRLHHIRRECVGFVFQSFNLLEALNPVENVELPMNFAGKNGSDTRKRAEEILRGIGLGDRLTSKPTNLSGGEKQRVSIARALANDPQLVLADEPTANLDSQRGQAVAATLREIAQRERRAVVIVSHDDRIREVADRVLWLEDGRLRDMERTERTPEAAAAS
jgi:putative ABC transport system ATP-binding protein